MTRTAARAAIGNVDNPTIWRAGSLAQADRMFVKMFMDGEVFSI
jgi:hypothetical protein